MFSVFGAWAASKWMIPWADLMSRELRRGYTATVQGWWAVGTMLGSFSGAQVAEKLGGVGPTQSSAWVPQYCR
jgi:hypothetical protein